MRLDKRRVHLKLANQSTALKYNTVKFLVAQLLGRKLTSTPLGIVLFALLTCLSPAAFGSTPQLNLVSCGVSSFTGTGSDSCSVYLTGKTSRRLNVSLSSNNAAVVVPSGVTVAAGASTTGFKATISPVSLATTVIITVHLGTVTRTFLIQLSPVVTTTASLGVNATSVAFGGVVINTTATQSVTLTSTGSAPVTVSAAVATGTGYAISGYSLPVTLNPGQSTTLNVQFDPPAAGTAIGQVTISSNSAPNGTVTISLSGIGETHEVDLSWSPPVGSDDPIAGYHVYRAPSGSTAYQLLSASIDVLTAYSDSTVVSGQSYDYVVTTVDASGVESVPSNITSLSIL